MDSNLKTVLVTDMLSPEGAAAITFFSEKGWLVVVSDLTSDITRLFQENKFDAIIHSTSRIKIEDPIEDFDKNVRMTLFLLENVRKYTPKAVFVNVSTDKVYGSAMVRKNLRELETRYDSPSLFSENISIDNSAHTLFGVARTSIDLYVQEYGRSFGMKTVNFRCSSIVSKGGNDFLSILVKNIKQEIPNYVYGYNGKQVKDVIHAYDLINAAWHFISRPARASIYNMGGGRDRSVSIIEAVSMIENLTGKKAILNFDPNPKRGERVWDIHDVTRFQRHYPDWKYRYSLEDILKEMCI